MTPKEFRAAHQPERPPYLGVNLREGDCRCLAQGVVTDSVRQMAQDALKEFWPVAEAEKATAAIVSTTPRRQRRAV